MEESYPVRFCQLPAVFRINDRLLLGATANAYRCGEAVFAKARNVTGLGAKGIKHGNQRLRFPGRPRSSVYLLEAVVNGPGSSEGMGSCSMTLPFVLIGSRP